MTAPDEPFWDLGDLPFVWKPLVTPHNLDGLPDALPFRLAVSPVTGALVQAPREETSRSLARAYELGSAMAGQMDESGIGRRYADDFLDFLCKSLARTRFDGLAVLEIGCGNGYLLHRLAALGAKVIGLEPGAGHFSSTFDVPVVRDFFPSSQVEGTFDLIIMFAVLEHVEDPHAFLERVRASLRPQGDVIVAVPDCAPYIEAGDLSFLVHEHWSSFDRVSLARTFDSWRGEVTIERAGFGGMLYARVASGRPRPAASITEGSGALTLERFRKRAERSIGTLRNYFDAAAGANETIGIYVPARLVNLLFVAGMRGGFRFFDDNPLLKGTYFPGLPVAVEDRADLLAKPTDHVLIMSQTFGDAMAAALAKVLPPKVAIETWHALLARDASSDRAS